MNYCIQLSMVLDVDIVDIINKKMDNTEKKYPVDKAKGVSTKYDKLVQLLSYTNLYYKHNIYYLVRLFNNFMLYLFNKILNML